MTEQKETGNFVISLDFEIYWGVWDVVSLDEYREHLLGVRKVIPSLLDLFGRYHIQATFATVGFLFFENRKALLEALPAKQPQYDNPDISPYKNQMDKVGENEADDPFHYAGSLIRMIQSAGQEVACHTFSHYYCLETGQTIDDFRADLQAAKHIAEKWGIELKSFVFPRNQYNEAYLKVCHEEGITSFRGNEVSWIYTAKTTEGETYLRRGARLLDAYINLSGHHSYSYEYMKSAVPFNIPSSRFLRPYSGRFSPLEWLRLRRIKKGMTHAAKHGLTYHLWWHPHNFGINLEQNIAFLEKILIHYQYLSQRYGFRNASMQQLANILSQHP